VKGNPGDFLEFIDFLHGTESRASSIKNLSYCYAGLAQPLTAGWSAKTLQIPFDESTSYLLLCSVTPGQLITVMPCEQGNFSISWGKLYFVTIHWIPAFAGMTGIYIQTSFRRKPESRHLTLSY